MDPTETVEEYYESLRRGAPLAPYFVERADVVKFGVGERLAGGRAVAEGLAEQTRTTDDWRVDSRRLRVTERGSVAWFTDDVGLSWTGPDGDRRSFDTRWSGVLERVSALDGADGADDSGGDRPADWRFAQMHVSAPHDL